MKRYYVDGKEITEAQANIITEENNRLINSGDISLLMGCKFITIIDK